MAKTFLVTISVLCSRFQSCEAVELQAFLALSFPPINSLPRPPLLPVAKLSPGTSITRPIWEAGLRTSSSEG